MKRSKFSLSYYNLLSCSQGELVPVGLTEVLPGDTIQQATSALVRVSPLLSPVMHPVHVRIHHWFVPHRLVWNNGEDDSWESFITGGPDGMDASTFPTITFGGGSGAAVGSLADYLGVPTGVNNIEVSALPFRAYALIFNEWYRDQDLVTPLVIDKTGGADTTTNTTLQNSAWEKDYFTSARPWTQKGPAVSIPLSGDAPLSATEAPVVGLNTDITFSNESDGTARIFRTQNSSTIRTGLGSQPSADGDARWGATALEADLTGIEADLSGVTAADVNDLRLAFALQRYEEARARYGSRYTEYLRYLGVRSSDARLQRPEYLGGGKQTIQFSEVLATAETGTSVDVGDLKGHGIGAVRSNRYRRFFEEHGYVLTFMTVKPKTVYAQGLFRHWNRRTKEDFWQRELQHIGQQEVLNKEVYAGAASPNGVFGYQDRYDEYRRTESRIGGEFRSTLNFWHMARIFGSEPALNADFVEADPTTRIYATGASADNLWCMVNHSIQARRLVAKTGTSYIF